MDTLFNRSTNIIKMYMAQVLSKDSVVVDCTLGNGHDALYAKELMGHEGKLYGFDIQALAIENTKTLLKDKGCYHGVKLIMDTHENIDHHVKEQADLIMYNLGFLPGGDKNVTTNVNSTKESLKKAFDILKQYGIITVIFYPGHGAGKIELDQIMADMKLVDQRAFDIHHGHFINQKNNPPEYVVIQKRTR